MTKIRGHKHTLFCGLAAAPPAGHVLRCFCQWKQLGEQEYVMGLIPSNGYAEGRNAARENRELVMLEPGEKKTVTLELSVEEGKHTLG